MNKLKKNWKEILIVLLILFGMNKCTVSCNRGSKLNKANQEIVYKDSLNKAMADSIKSLNVGNFRGTHFEKRKFQPTFS